MPKSMVLTLKAAQHQTERRMVSQTPINAKIELISSSYEGTWNIASKKIPAYAYRKRGVIVLCNMCTPEWIRTTGPQLRRLLLYPTELRAHQIFVRIFYKINMLLMVNNTFYLIFFDASVYLERITNSVLLLSDLPSSVELSAIGTVSP